MAFEKLRDKLRQRLANTRSKYQTARDMGKMAVGVAKPVVDRVFDSKRIIEQTRQSQPRSVTKAADFGQSLAQQYPRTVASISMRNRKSFDPKGGFQEFVFGKESVPSFSERSRQISEGQNLAGKKVSPAMGKVGAGAEVALNLEDLITPGIPEGALAMGILGKADEGVDAVRTISKSDDALDIFNKTDELMDIAKQGARKMELDFKANAIPNKRFKAGVDKLDELRSTSFDLRNATEEQILKAMDDIRNGKIRPIVKDIKGNILDGTHRKMAAKRLGLDRFPTIIEDTGNNTRYIKGPDGKFMGSKPLQ